MKNKKRIENTWKLFENDFKKGDEVVIITEDDMFAWGKLSWTRQKVFLKDANGKNKEYSWNNIVFICHDGFPVRKLKGADGSEAIMRENKADTSQMIREALTQENWDKIKKREMLLQQVEELEKSALSMNIQSRKIIEAAETGFPLINYIPPPRQFVVRDPFLIKGREVTLYNPGNSGLAFEESPLIETLMLRSGDGAVAFLWDLDSVFHAE